MILVGGDQGLVLVNGGRTQGIRGLSAPLSFVLRRRTGMGFVNGTIKPRTCASIIGRLLNVSTAR